MEKLLLYCSKSLPYLAYFGYGSKEYRYFGKDKKSQDLVFVKEGFDGNDISDYLNGKVVAECDCNLVEKILPQVGVLNLDCGCPENPIFLEEPYYDTKTLSAEELYKKSCLFYDDMNFYLEDHGYALHLSNVNIFGNKKDICSKSGLPNSLNLKDLSDYYKSPIIEDKNKVERAPQNMCYVYDENGNRYILLPIKPRFLCKILNGEKTIEIRRAIVNALKESIR